MWKRGIILLEGGTTSSIFPTIAHVFLLFPIAGPHTCSLAPTYPPGRAPFYRDSSTCRLQLVACHVHLVVFRA